MKDRKTIAMNETNKIKSTISIFELTLIIVAPVQYSCNSLKMRRPTRRCPDNLIHFHFVDASCGRTGLDLFALDFIY
jgi:hypothetical protein